jgi:hypothetical protein
VASLNKEEDYSVFEVWIFLRSFKKEEAVEALVQMIAIFKDKVRRKLTL